jgi:uncharacterized membrane protein
VIHLILLIEASIFFIKLFVVVVTLLFSFVSMYSTELYNQWKNSHETEKAYEAVMNNEKWRIPQSEIDPQEFCII